MIRAIFLAAMLAACAPTQPPQEVAAAHAPPEPAPLPAAAEAVEEAVAEPVAQAIDAVVEMLPPEPAPPAVEGDVAQCATELIIRWEITSPAAYRRLYERPVWPGGASGVTWGIGYDGGHQASRTILEDWAEHVERERLAETAGVRGQRARAALPAYRDIVTPFDFAQSVFRSRTLIQYERQTRRAFPGYDDLRVGARCALISLVYNRGSSMTGDSRREMRELRDTCIPAGDYSCIADRIRSMKRLWIGTTVEKGLSARREDEAKTVESS